MFATTYKRSTVWSVALGLLLLAAGLMAIAVPPIAGLAASVFFGWLLLFAGVAHMVYAWSVRGAGAVVWQVMIGAVYVIAALYIMVLPVAGLVTLTLVFAYYIVVSGIFELVVFARLRRLRGSIWFLVDGLASLLLAGLIFFHWPLGSSWFIGTLVGISLLLSGLARITFPLILRPTTVERSLSP